MMQTSQLQPSRNKARSIGACLLAFAVAGCEPLISFGGDGPADDTYTLRYDAAYVSPAPDAPIIYVDSPHMVEGLDGHGVAVLMDDGQRTTLEGVSWSAHLSDLIRDYVSRALGSKTGANIITEGGLDIKAGCRLGIKVLSFEFAPGQTSADDTVDIALQFSLVRMQDSRLLSHPTFAKSVSVSGSELSSVIDAFDKAMNRTADDYGDWLAGNMAQCSE